MEKWKNPFAIGLHELLVRATPESVLRRTIRQQVGFDAGDLS